jgi:hypothetical protein
MLIKTFSSFRCEAMSMQIRARGNAFATGIGKWLVATFWTQVSLISLRSIGWRLYFVFVAFDMLVTLPVISPKFVAGKYDVREKRGDVDRDG